MSIKKGKIVINGNQYIQSINFTLPLQFVFGFQNLTAPFQNHTAEFKPQLNKGCSHMYIYSNVVNFTQVGESLTPILRCINIKNESEFGKELVYIPKKPMYLDVNPSSINKFEINIRGNDGNLIPFAETAITTINLNFKRV